MARHDRLFSLLEQLSDEELSVILKTGLGRKERHLSREQSIDLISAKLREAAANSFANYFRFEHEFPYKQILIDVTKQLSDKEYFSYQLEDNHSEEEIEKEILRLFDLKIQEWWKRLDDKEKNKMAEKIFETIDANTVNSINRVTLIKKRVFKEVMDSIITKGVVVSMLAISAGGMLGVLGGSMLSQIGWKFILEFKGLVSALNILTRGVLGLSGIGALNLIGGVIAGIAVFVPSTIFFYSETNFKKTIPTIIMLLAKVHLNKSIKS